MAEYRAAGGPHIHDPQAAKPHEITQYAQRIVGQQQMRRDVDSLSGHVECLQWCGIGLAVAVVIQAIFLVLVVVMFA